MREVNQFDTIGCGEFSSLSIELLLAWPSVNTMTILADVVNMFDAILHPERQHLASAQKHQCRSAVFLTV